MEEIKIRVWDAYNCSMTYDPLAWTDIANEIICDETGQLVSTDRYKLILFTGLKDRNGKEIYETHIVNFETSIWDYQLEDKNPTGHDACSYVKGVGVIEYKATGCFKIKVVYLTEGTWLNTSGDPAWYDQYNIEDYFKDRFLKIGCVEKVIGNIYENPELLEK